MACVLTSLFPRWRTVFYGAGTLAAAARLVNGAHFVSDVVAGAMLGALVAGSVMRLGMKHEARLLGLFSRRRPAQ
jgi:membrane-associated phospholipid phosphatase